MSVIWLQPLAWVALLGVSIPIAIHLLTRARTQRVPFPSLRFIPRRRDRALQRRVISDWPLLLVRVLVVASAAAALAAPVFVSDGRRAAWQQRVSRAVVVTQGASAEAETLSQDERRRAFTSAVFQKPVIADSLREASGWLARQPPSAREVVLVGDFRERSLTDRDFDHVPPSTGIRFLPVTTSPSPSQVTREAVGESATGGVQRETLQVSATERETVVERVASENTQPFPVTVHAAADDQAHAEAVLRAVLRNGLVLGPDLTRRVMVIFRGGAPAVAKVVPPSEAWMRDALALLPEGRGGEHNGTLVVRSEMSATDPRAPEWLAHVLRASFAENLEVLEPRPIPAALLVAWSRPAAPQLDEAPIANERDARWLWLVALGLMTVEQIQRRAVRAAPAESSEAASALAEDRESRVA